MTFQRACLGEMSIWWRAGSLFNRGLYLYILSTMFCNDRNFAAIRFSSGNVFCGLKNACLSKIIIL